MRIPPKYLKIGKIALVLIVSLLFAGAIVAFAMRDAILRSIVDRGIKKAKSDYNLNVKIKDYQFSGFSTVVFNTITVVPDERDSLAYIKDLRVGVRLFPLLFGNVKLSELKMNSAKLNLVRKDSISNYDFLFRKKSADTLDTHSKVNLSKLANNLLNKMLNKIPDDMDIDNFAVYFKDNLDSLNFHSTARIRNGKLNSTILVNGNESTWHLNGDVDPDNRQLDIVFFADGKKVELPYLERKYALKLKFDTLHTKMDRVSMSGSELSISGTWSVKNLLVDQPRITSNEVLLPSGSIDALMIVGENFISLDSSSVIRIKNITANPYIKYTLYPSKIYELKLQTGELDAQQLFDSFPPGLFETLEGIRVAGKLRYKMNFYLDKAYPDSVIFDSGLEKKDFRILSQGKTNLQRINGPFVHTPYEVNGAARSFVIGPENPNYVSLENIAPDLRNAVMTAEDPSFFSHRGFVMQAFRNSLVADFKTNSFKRGGSTISMQLVKNVYLNRQKNLARKIEEILIVWLIENAHLSDKRRMYEVYLNLIEWGRNIYGISEASYYYFGKSPSQLSLGESIFLANIVPRPKSSLYFFEPDGSLRGSLKNYFGFIGGVMARRGLTAPDSSGSYGFYSVRLKESLRKQIAPLDSMATDKLILDEDLDDQRQILQDILGKRPKMDTINVRDLKNLRVAPKDTVKTPAQLRRERRETRRQERSKN